jgi:hypothetical protein
VNRKQKIFTTEKQVLDAIEANLSKAQTKWQESFKHCEISREKFLQAGQFEDAASLSTGWVPCPQCGGKSKGKVNTEDFCVVCRGMGKVNREALLSYAAGIREQAKWHRGEADRQARGAKRLIDKKGPVLKQALAEMRTPSFDFAPQLPVVMKPV